MRKLLLTVLFAMILVILSTGAVFAADYQASLVLDGESVETDVAPMLVQDEETGNWRTLIPLRALFEGMGGEVSWDGDARIASVSMGNTTVRLTIDHKSAFVNGVESILDVPATIVNGRTMIPLRFVSEALHCGVNWDNATRTAYVTSPEKPLYTGVNNIFVEETPDAYRVTVMADSYIAEMHSFAFDSPDRFIVDLNTSKLLIDTAQIAANNEIFSKVRYAQFDDDTVRVVMDLNEQVAGRVSFSADRTSVYIDFAKASPGIGQLPEYEDPSDVLLPWESDEGFIADNDQPVPGILPSDEDDPVVNRGDSDRDLGSLPELDWRAAGKLIVIDPGHGGVDVGAIGTLPDGSDVYEKDINLDVALRLYDYLYSAGANVTMLRYDDTGISLYTRPEMANTMGADLYVAVHNNSNVSSSPNGLEVHYYNKEWEAGYGYSSKDLAKEVYRQLVAHQPLKGRDYISSPKLAVLNKTMMPAIIIEGAFISNPSDLAYMVTDEFKENYALAAAIGIINVLNASAANQ